MLLSLKVDKYVNDKILCNFRIIKITTINFIDNIVMSAWLNTSSLL